MDIKNKTPGWFQKKKIIISLLANEVNCLESAVENGFKIFQQYATLTVNLDKFDSNSIFLD